MVDSGNSAVSAGLKNIQKASQQISGAFQKLASGSRITKASDDAAGVAVLAQLDASVVSLGQAGRNITDTTSALQIADGAMEQVQGLTGRLQELATQAANGSYSDEQRAALKQEYSAVTQEIQRIGETTEFNGIKLLKGDSVSTQVGTDDSPNSTLQSSGIDVGGLASSAASQDIGTQEGAQAALSTLNDLSANLSQSRGSALGAAMSRLESASTSVEVRQAGEQEAASRIGDADVAESLSQAIRGQTLAQVSTAVMAQAVNLDRDRVKALLG